ncbi:MAG: hypothetical protein KC643_28135 [Nitrospira sp.]|nr:hypothetical protein [Nitrospira sp.]
MPSKRCFVISPIGKEGSDERQHANDVLDLIIKPAVLQCEIQAFRADQLHEPGKITHQMFREILQADFCIALLTGLNPNVFYELAIAQAANKPVIVLMEKNGEELPFDIKDLRCMYYDLEPRAIRERTSEKVLIQFIQNLKEKDWKAEPLLSHMPNEWEWGALPQSYAFDQIISEISDTVTRLEKNDGALVRFYQEKGDGQRLFDGLYSSVLYASRAVITGSIHALYYGNLMEWNVPQHQLRVRYFAGPYNDEIITRSFPIEGPGQGLASEAWKTGEIQVMNTMDSELKVKGESRLKAMMSIPIGSASNTNSGKQSSTIALLNIDAGREHAFQQVTNETSNPIHDRIKKLVLVVSRINHLYRQHMEPSKNG